MRFLSLLLICAFACGDDDSTPMRDSGMDVASCVENEVECRGRESYVCRGGTYVFDEDCGDTRVCALDLGCRDCQPGRPFCEGDDVRICGDDGMSSMVQMTCSGTAVCEMGSCVDACADAAARGGENGCRYIAPGGGTVTLINRQDEEVSVTIRIADGTETMETLMPLRSSTITLPEEPLVLSTNRPVKAFGELDQDASLWLADHVLGTRYRVLSWPGDPERIWVLGSTTNVIRVTPSTDAFVNGDAVTAGMTMTVNVDALVPVEIEGFDDLTGTLIETDDPVAVFLDLETATVPLDGTAPAHPDGAPGSWGSGRLGAQLLPVDAWGSRYVVALAPARADHATFREPEIVRVVADVSGTEITTTLAAPDDAFTLGQGELRDIAVQGDFGLESTEPVSVAQMLVAGEWVVTPRSARGGSPAFGLVPALDGQRRFFYFAGLSSTVERHLVVSAPMGTSLRFDGVDVATLSECTAGDAITLGAETWQTTTCFDIDMGAHLIDGDVPIVGSIFGHDADRSYAAPIGGDYR